MASRYLRQEHTIYLRGKKLNEGKENGETSHAISQNVSSHVIKKAIFFYLCSCRCQTKNS